jgi:RNA polymerase sigma factor (sigma-70 family)
LPPLQDFQAALVALLPRLRRFARALAGDAADADDLTQVAVERALARRSQWRAGTRLDSWMFQIMKNAWIDETRARSRRARVLSGPEAGERVADPSIADPATREAARAAQAAMAQLPDDQRLAVALVLIEGLSYKEAAAVLQVPEGTLTSRLVRGRAALIERLQGEPA